MPFEREKKGSSWSLVLMIVISCITQVATLMKSSIVAGTFGATESMDAYQFANSIVSFLLGVVAAGIPTVILPAHVKKEDRKGIDSFITLVYGALFALIVIILLLRFQIVGLFSDRSEYFANLACNALVIVAFSQYLTSINSITAAYYQHKGKYNTPKIINLLVQLIVLVALVAMKNITIYQYMYVLAGGATLNFLIDIIIAVISGWRYKPSIFLQNPTFQRLWHCFFPIVFSSSVYRLSLFVDSLIASNLEEGKLATLGYASQIAGMVNTIFIGNLLIYVYPKIIKKISIENDQRYFWRQTVFYHLLVCLIAAGFAAAGKEGIAVLFQRGLFNEALTKSVYIGALIYILGQQFNIVRDLVYRYFYSIGNTKIPAQNGILVSVTNIAVSIMLVILMGFYGIIIGTVIASMISTVVILFRFYNTIGFTVAFRNILFKYIGNIVNLVLTTSTVFVTKHFLPIENNIIAIVLYGLETAIIYGMIAVGLNRKEIHVIKEHLHRNK